MKGLQCMSVCAATVSTLASVRVTEAFVAAPKSLSSAGLSARPLHPAGTITCNAPVKRCRAGSALHMSLVPPQQKKDSETVCDDQDIMTEVEVEEFNPFNVEVISGDISPTSNVIQNMYDETEKEEDDGEISIWAARALLLGVAILWGTNFASVKYLETLCFHPPCHHPPSEAALARFGVAALVSLPLLINQRKDVILAGLECGLWITLGYVTQAMALTTVAAGKTAFICSLTVVVVPLISALFFGKPIKPVNIISAALALSGVGVLEGLVDVNSLMGIQPAMADATTVLASAAPDAVASSSALTANAVSAAGESTGWLASLAGTLGVGKGDLLALGQPIGFGLSFMRIEHYVEKFKDVENRILTISAAQCVAVGLMSLLWVLIDFHGHIPNMAYMIEPHRIGAIAWTGIMTTVVAIYIEGVALQKASATEAALTFSSEPVWASLFGAWLLHERLNANSYVGGAIILAACVLGAVADLPAASEEVNGDKE